MPSWRNIRVSPQVAVLADQAIPGEGDLRRASLSVTGLLCYTL